MARAVPVSPVESRWQWSWAEVWCGVVHWSTQKGHDQAVWTNDRIASRGHLVRASIFSLALLEVLRVSVSRVPVKSSKAVNT